MVIIRIINNSKKLNLANWLTTSRVGLIPLCILSIMWDIPHSRVIALTVFIVAGLTDALDGYVARLRKETSDFGRFFDPLADKILIISVLVSLAIKIGEAWCWWAVGIICFREAFVALMRRGFAQHASIDTNSFGKIKTLIQCIAVGGLIVRAAIAPYLLWVSVIFTVFSGIYYINSWKKKPKGISRHDLTLRDGSVKDGSSAYN